MSADITAIILTKNESKNIKDCIESISSLVKRIVVVDSGSVDNTVEISKSMGAEVFFHCFENYSNQFNWGIDNVGVSTAWILRIDADERFTKELCSEIDDLIENPKGDNTNGIILEAKLFFMGKWIKHGGSKKRKLMLFKTGFGRIEDRMMDEHTILFAGKSINAKEKFLHYDFKDLNFFVDKLNWYATREVKDFNVYLANNSTYNHSLFDKKITSTRKMKYGFYYKLPLFFRTWLLFIYFYYFKLGFLDGVEGYIYHYLYQRWYRLLVDAKIYEERQKRRS